MGSLYRKIVCLDCGTAYIVNVATCAGICPICKGTHVCFESAVKKDSKLRKRLRDITKGISVSSLDA